MKHWKLILALFISFALGIAVSRGFLTKRAVKIRAAEEHHEEENELELSKKSQDLIALKTIHAELSTFKKKISVVGQIAQDAETSVHVVSPVSGQVIETKAQIGSLVKKDDILCTVSKINGETAIHEVRAPITGMIIGAFIKEGSRVDTVSSLYTIADLTKLGGTLEVYEKDIAGVKLGQKIIAQSVAYPKENFIGEITFISPRVDESTHTIKVRALIQNPDYHLKLGMFITADIIIESQEKYIILPQGTVHPLGGKKIVFVKKGDEKFEVQEVTIADESKEEVAVAGGISEGDEIVVQDGFLLKSEFLKSKMGEGCAE
jgi:multidrug efflux pump subunit AcrA (membrane-fusion protein)